MVTQDKLKDSYNMVLLKNPMDEDFIFGYDNKKDSPDYNEEGNYAIKAGETKPYPKFIANVAMKHLIDKILMKKDPQGKLIGDQKGRDAVALTIFVREEKYDRPVIPTNRQIVEQMGTDMDRILAKNRERLASEAGKTEEDIVTPEVGIPVEVPTTGPVETYDEVITPPVEEFKDLSKVDIPVMPTREQMMTYAVGTLKIDLDTVVKAKGKNYGKTTREVFDSMSEPELYKELQIEENGGINNG